MLFTFSFLFFFFFYFILFFYGDKQKFETQVEGLIIWGKDEGKGMGFQSFTFTIIL
jgi:hypothetical protein